MGGCDACSGSGGGCNSTGVVEIVQGYDKDFFVELFYLDSELPYDLTGATEIVAAFPGVSAPVLAKLTLATVAVEGAPGAGRIKVKATAALSALMLPDPSGSQTQDLQVVVTNATATKTVFVIQGVLSILTAPYGVI